MGWFSRKQQTARSTREYRPNPHANANVRSAGFFSGDVDRLLSGWQTQSSSIDAYLRTELVSVRARSRRMVRANPYGKRFISAIKSNVVGHSGVQIQVQSLNRQGGLDDLANTAVEQAWLDWGSREVDYNGKLSWIDIQVLAISAAAQDGEFIMRKHIGRGMYGLQLEVIDPERLDATKNTINADGSQTRLGVQYDLQGRVVAYHIKRLSSTGDYNSGEVDVVDAREIIHGFINEWPDQSRGIPWMHAALERAKHLEKYEEAALVKARSTAATMSFLRSNESDAYEGDEDYGDGVTLDQYEAGTIKDIGNREVVHADNSYPHQMYGAFVKVHLQSIASGLGVSYHSLANDLEGVNYSSIRAGVLEDREVYKALQAWFVRTLIRPVYESWMNNAYLRGAIRIGSFPLSKPISEYKRVHYQPKRWAWVDPQKDGFANELALKNRLKSYSQLMREQGDDPDTVWREIERDRATMQRLGILPTETEQETEAPDDAED